MCSSDLSHRSPLHQTSSGKWKVLKFLLLFLPSFSFVTNIKSGILEGLELVGEVQDILRDVRKGTRDAKKEETVAKIAKELLASSSHLVQSAEWSLTDGVLYFRGKVYVPDNSDLRWRIVAFCHNTRVARHGGRWKTLELVSRNYWLPQMSQYVGKYVSTCDLSPH